MMRSFTFSDVKSNKFWEIDLQGKRLTVRFGRLGGAGQTQVRDFADKDAAQKEHDRLVAEKLKKGYRETTSSAKPAATSLRDSLEQALVEDPDDLVSHMAYADYLTEQGDPRGDFIRVQLALEDTAKHPFERKNLAQQEAALLKAHAKEWLGELAPYCLKQKRQRDAKKKMAIVTFARGWIDSLEVSEYDLAFTRILAKAPQVRLMRNLTMDYNDDFEGDPGADDIPEDVDFPALYPLARCPYLTNVRTFLLGELISQDEELSEGDGGWSCYTRGDGVVGMIKVMPKLRELYLLASEVDADQIFALPSLNHLRVLLLYHNHSYPLAKLAKNPSLGNLTHLLCHPHALEDDDAYIRAPAVRAIVRSPVLKSLTHLRLRLSDMGDKGVKEIVDSGILNRLKFLDLRHGCVSDIGARRLAACKDVTNLEHLDVTNNCLTEEGLGVLRATGVNVVSQHQWTPTGDEADDQMQYLFAGDIE